MNKPINEMEHLNKVTFLEKVFNFETNKEWKYEGNLPCLIDFYADWCAQCKELDKYTYVDPKVIELSKKFNNIKVDLTHENTEITDKFKILGLPVVAFIDKNGKEIDQLRITGFLKPDEFTKLMEKALNN